MCVNVLPILHLYLCILVVYTTTKHHQLLNNQQNTEVSKDHYKKISNKNPKLQQKITFNDFESITTSIFALFSYLLL